MKAIIIIAVVAVLLWFLHPPLQLTTKTPEGAEVVEITFMEPGGPLTGALEDMVDAFERESRLAHEKDPSKPIYRVISGQNAIRDQSQDPTRFLVSIAGGVPPDVVMFDRFAIAEWAARGAFEPLDCFVAADKAAGRTDYPHNERFFDGCWDEVTYGGSVFGVPFSVDNRALAYNKDLLEKAGLIYQSGPLKGQAKPPLSWAELEDYALRLTEWADEAHTKLKVLGFSPRQGQGWLYTFGWANGGELLSEDGHTCMLNEPRMVEALAYMKRIYDRLGGYENVLGFEAGFGIYQTDPLIRGQLAMRIEVVSVVEYIAAHGPDFNVGIAALPMSERERAKLSPRRRKENLTVSWRGGSALAIPSTAKNKQAAWELVRFMCSDRGFRIQAESRRQMAEAQGQLPFPQPCPVKHLNEEFFKKYFLDNPHMPQRFVDGMRVFNALLPYSRYRPVTPVGQRMWKAQIDAMDAAFYGEDPQAALDYQTAIVQRELDAFHAPKHGREIHSWNWFFTLYGLLILVLGALVYLWDTHVGLRTTAGRLLPWLKHSPNAVIAGARGGYFRKQWKEGLFCASPWIIGFVLFSGGPMLFSIVMSLCDYDVINTPRFIGLDNYRAMFGKDHLFTKSLWNTAYMVLSVPLGMAVSLAIALLLNLKIRGIAFWRTLFYLPAIVPMVAVSVLFISIFNPQYGLLNRGLAVIGVDGPNWLGDAIWSKPSLIVMGLWGAGAGMIIWLAGLKGISASLYEAAEVDGANALKKFRHVTLPQLTPYVFFNLVMGMIGTFQIFGQAFIMTQGGPNNTTLFFVYYLFNNAFSYGKMGYASAMAWVLFVMVLVLTIVQLKGSKYWVHYESE